MNNIRQLAFGYETKEFDKSLIIHADCFEWLSRLPENCFHAVVTDPPYGVREFDDHELEKRSNGKGGIWRIPPSFDGHKRSPLPRFTALDERDRERISLFFEQWGRLALKPLRPGGHALIATNAFIASLLYAALAKSGLEFRGQIIRLVRTLRGGDRPKNAEQEFPGVSSLPRGCYEPWGLFRKPLPRGMKVSDCLREYQTGGLRRLADNRPFEDVIPNERTPRRERDIADHPSLKPQSFMRQIVRAALPLDEGIIVDPFLGSGSTVAAAEAVGVSAVGVERYRDYYDMACQAIPKLKSLPTPEIDSLVGTGQQNLLLEIEQPLKPVLSEEDQFLFSGSR